LIEWGQLGNHDLELFTTRAAVRCDAGRVAACIPTGGAHRATRRSRASRPASYHLVVDADVAGKEGGVLLQITGVLSP